MHKIKAFSILGVATALALAACGSGGGSLCNSLASKCSADPPPTQSALDTCYTATSGACGAQYDAVGNCAFANQVCGPDNKTNSMASLAAVEANCATALAAAQACCAQNPSACPK
jgi:hypothetical protein